MRSVLNKSPQREATNTILRHNKHGLANAINTLLPYGDLYILKVRINTQRHTRCRFLTDDRECPKLQHHL